MANSAAAQPKKSEPLLNCEYANGPTDTYVGSIDMRTGVFLFRCLVFADRAGVAFGVTYRSPPLGTARPDGVIGAGWGTSFDDVVLADAHGRAVIRNGVDGSVDAYGPARRDKPMLVAGRSPDERERRAQACEYVQRHGETGLRRVYCSRTIQHFDAAGRLIDYSTHAFHQVFTLERTGGGLAAVTSYAPDDRPIRAGFSREDRRLVVSDQDGRTVTFDFDEAGRLAWARSSAGEDYGFTYGADVSLATVTFPDGRTQHMAYDAKGRIAAIDARDGGGAQVVYGRHVTEIRQQATDGTQGVSRLTF
jgi:YD repeat-containing protein